MSFFFSPQSGPPGTSVNLFLDSISFINGVTFNNVAANFFLNNDSGLYVAVVPQGATTGQIRVTFFGGSASSGSNFTVTGVPVQMPPSINGISPTTGPAGTVVTLSGSNLQNINTATINNIPCLLQSVLATQVKVVVPGNAPSGRIVLSGSTGTATAPVDFIFAANPNAPAVNGFSPSSGNTGTSVTITGLRFANATQVFFNGIPASFSIISDTSISASVPVTNTGKVSVANASGVGTSVADFTIINQLGAPSVSGFTPTSGKAGDVITVSGLNLSNVTQFLFNGVSASFTPQSNISLKATVPAGAATGKLAAVNPFGQGMSAVNFTVNTPPALPIVTAFNPAMGRVREGVDIIGTGFSGASSVIFSGGKAATFSEENGTLIRAIVPAGAVSGPVTITTPAGSKASALLFTVIGVTINPPSVTGFSPASGGLNLLVTITGSGFTGTTAVAFGGVSAMTYIVVNDTTIQVRVPPNAKTGVISVMNPAGTAFSTASFRFIDFMPAPPRIFGFTPSGGPAGTAVTVTGDNLSTVTSVTLGASPCSITSLVDQQLTFIVPANAASGLITVTGTVGTASSLTEFMVTGGNVPPPPGGNSGGKIKFSKVVVNPAPIFDNEFIPQYQNVPGADDEGLLTLISGQSVKLTYFPINPNGDADLVLLRLENSNSGITATLSVQQAFALEPFDINISTQPSLADGMYQVVLRGTGTIPPPLEYTPFTIRIQVFAPVEILPGGDAITSIAGSSVFRFRQIRRRFNSTEVPSILNLPSNVMASQPVKIDSRSGLPEEGGGKVERFETIISALSNAAEFQGKFLINPNKNGGMPANAFAKSFMPDLTVNNGTVEIIETQNSMIALKPGESFSYDLIFKSDDFYGKIFPFAEVTEINPGPGNNVPPEVTVFFDSQKRFLPGNEIRGTFNISTNAETRPNRYNLLFSFNYENGGSGPESTATLEVSSRLVTLETDLDDFNSLYPGETREFNARIMRAQGFTEPLVIKALNLPQDIVFRTLPNFPGPDDNSVKLFFTCIAAEGSGGFTPIAISPFTLIGDTKVGNDVIADFNILSRNLGVSIDPNPILIPAANKNIRCTFVGVGYQQLAPNDELVYSFDPTLPELPLTSEEGTFVRDSPSPVQNDNFRYEGKPIKKVVDSNLVLKIRTNGVNRFARLNSRPIQFIFDVGAV